MAIAGLLLHALKDNLASVEAALQTMPEFTTYGVYEDQYLVVVAEAPSGRLESLVDGLKELAGVLTVYTTYVTVEDELENAPA